VIDPNALEYYHYTNDPTQAFDDTLERAMDDYLNDENKYEHIPFELFCTEVGYGNGPSRVDTKVIGIKSNVEYGNLLNELLLRMKIGNHIFPNVQYVPVGLAANIGSASYMQLIRENNAYLTALTSIPVQGFNDRILNYTIPVRTDDNREEPRTIREILMATNWCVQIEPTQNPGRILILTTKRNLETGRDWLDDNLTTISTHYLPENPRYQSESEHLIPYHTDIRPTNATLDNYADSLKKRINLQPATQTAPQQFAHPPATCTPPLTTISYCAAAQKNITSSTGHIAPPKNKKAKRTDAISTTKHSQETAQTSTTTTTHLNLQAEILTTIRAEVWQLIQTNLQLLQNELKTMTQTVTTLANKTTTEFQNIHQQLTANQDHFQQQMDLLATCLKEQQEHQAHFENQMQAMFLRFSQLLPALNSPSSMDEEGMN